MESIRNVGREINPTNIWNLVPSILNILSFCKASQKARNQNLELQIWELHRIQECRSKWCLILVDEFITD